MTVTSQLSKTAGSRWPLNKMAGQLSLNHETSQWSTWWSNLSKTAGSRWPLEKMARQLSLDHQTSRLSKWWSIWWSKWWSIWWSKMEEYKIPVVPLVVQMMVRKRRIQESTGGPFGGPHKNRRYLRLPVFQLDCNLFINQAY